MVLLCSCDGMLGIFDLVVAMQWLVVVCGGCMQAMVMKFCLLPV